MSSKKNTKAVRARRPNGADAPRSAKEKRNANYIRAIHAWVDACATSELLTDSNLVERTVIAILNPVETDAYAGTFLKEHATIVFGNTMGYKLKETHDDAMLGDVMRQAKVLEDALKELNKATLRVESAIEKLQYDACKAANL